MVYCCGANFSTSGCYLHLIYLAREFLVEKVYF